MKEWITLAIALAISTSPLAAQDIPLSKIIVESEGWREVAKGWPGVTFLQAYDSGGIVIFQGKAAGVLATNPKFEFDRGILGGFKHDEFQTVIRLHGWVYIAEKQSVYGENLGARRQKGRKQDRDRLPIALKLAGLKAPSCLAVWPDEGHLVIGEADGAYLWAVRIENDGSFGPGDRYYSLRTEPNKKMHVTAMTIDAGYLLYACTPLGIQVFDPTGRLSGVIAAPSKDTMTAITIGGAKADTLFVASGDKIYARKIQGKAVYTRTQKK